MELYICEYYINGHLANYQVYKYIENATNWAKAIVTGHDYGEHQCNVYKTSWTEKTGLLHSRIWKHFITSYKNVREA